MAIDDLHFGANLTLEVEETARQAQWMEEHEFEYFSAGEHFMRGDPPGPSHASLPVLAVAAGATTRLRILSSIVLAPFYHPLMLARTTATLDAASNGRLTLGVGIGGEYPAEFENSGLNVNQRGRRTDECLEVMRRLWQGEKVDFSGRHFNLEGAMINPLPTQKPHPPIWVSGRRDPAMRRAARFGNGWVPYFFDPPRYRDSVEKYTHSLRREVEPSKDSSGRFSLTFRSTPRNRRRRRWRPGSWAASTCTAGSSSTSYGGIACWELQSSARNGSGNTSMPGRDTSSSASPAHPRTGNGIWMKLRQS